MTIEIWLAFVATSSLLLVLPGPTILTVIGYSLTDGRRSSLLLVAAVALGDATAVTVSLLGLGALMAASAFWFTVVKWIGGLYLLYLGLRLLKAGRTAGTSLEPRQPASRKKLFIDTFLVTALNPKGIMFFVAFLPQFVTPGANSQQQLWTLAATFVVLAAINTALYALFASAASKTLTSPKTHRYFNFTGGTLLTSAGVWALLARRGE